MKTAEQRARISFREWIPVCERLPDIDGMYETLIKTVLHDAPFELVQRYTKQGHLSISGWTHARVTHWRVTDVIEGDL